MMCIIHPDAGADIRFWCVFVCVVSWEEISNDNIDSGEGLFVIVL